MLEFLLSLLAAVRVFFRTRAEVSLEVLALRQQVAVLKRERPRPILTRLDRFFWTILRHLWPHWSNVLIIVKPETVVRWHRAGFRLFWRWRSRHRGGRPRISEEIQTLIRRLATENADWGAPRIHGELVKLGFDVSERSVARYLRRLPRRRDSATRWSTFLANHREAIVACDFFTVPTLTFQLLSCFFIIEHHRRKILYFNVTREPTSTWVVQQLRDVFPGDGPHRFLLLDHDTIFDGDVVAFLKTTGVDPTRTGIRAPWQNGIAERWVGSCRRELLDHIIALNERHLYRLIGEYIGYYHQDRVHDALAKDAPNHRPVEPKPSAQATVISTPRAGGLHHRYTWRDAA
jgi:putative transposase